MVEPPVHLFPGITPQAEGWGVLMVVEFGFEERDWCDGTWSRDPTEQARCLHNSVTRGNCFSNASRVFGNRTRSSFSLLTVT